MINHPLWYLITSILCMAITPFFKETAYKNIGVVSGIIQIICLYGSTR